MHWKMQSNDSFVARSWVPFSGANSILYIYILLQRGRIGCNAERCISHGNSVHCLSVARWARGTSRNLGFHSIFTQLLKLATSDLVHSLGLPRPIINSHTEEKVDVVLTMRAPQNFGIFL